MNIDVFDSAIFEWQSLRLIAAAAIGAALGAVGSALQRYLNNDLADPYLLGLSGASVLGAVAMSLLFPDVLSSGPQRILYIYLLGALLAGGIVLALILWAKGRFYHNAEGLVVFGVVVNAVCASITMILMTFDSPLYPRIDYSWFIGRLESFGAEPTFLLLSLVILGCGALFLLRNFVERSPYGLTYLKNLGMKPAKLNVLLLVAIWITVSTVSAFAGSLGFVGLMIPHLARRSSQGYSRELVSSMILGGLFLAVADHVSRRLAYPRVLPVGIVTSFCGAIFLGILLWRGKALQGKRHA